MKILFIDSGTVAYDTKTWRKQPLGGTQSAVSCLSKELAALGHQVCVINGVADTVETDGVQFMHLPCPTPTLNEFDVIIPVSGAIARTLRGIGCTPPLALWCHHAADQPSIQELADPEERALFSGFAFVSQWQADRYIEKFALERNAVKVMRNAVSPAFMNVHNSYEWLRTGAAPTLGYTSTPYRGLDILLLSFASIRRQIPDATLHIFSSMGIYGPDTRDDYASFYDMAHALPGVTYVGPLPQPRLAEAMAGIDVWAYPCTFAETSCISALEAMASGNLLISTDLGALPETTAGFARLASSDIAQTSGMQATRFASFVAANCTEAMADAKATLAKLDTQVAFVRQNYNWKARAAEWSAWLEAIV